jgi:TolB-like protein/class 3 adenylate cyclase
VNAQDTSADSSPDLQLEIAHVLLIDVVGYSKLLVNEQIEQLQELNQIVRSTECFRTAESKGKLTRVPTGDGMALLFFRSPEEPARCALEISRTLKDHAHIQVRMGVHSGPVNQVTDVNDRTNIAGAGINVAQRLMDCADAGHILLSKHLADDFAEYRHWRPHLHDLGECEAKYGLRLHLVNLYKDDLGNPHLPQKLKRGKRWKQAAVPVRPIGAPRWPKSVLLIAMLGSAAALAVSFLTFFHRASLTTTQNLSQPAAAIVEKSIAVLPFQNLSDEKENAYFADGVQDEILTNLSKVANLKVISRTSVMQDKNVATRNLREIAEQLGVAHVLEGSVQRAGNRVRVTAQLIKRQDRRASLGGAIRPRFSRRLCHPERDCQEDADQLQAKISPSEKAAIEKPSTTDLAAYDLYLRAQELFADTSDPIHAREKLPQAAQLLDEAVARDPHFIQAWGLLSRVHGAAYFRGHDHTPARLGLANAAAQTALRLQPDAGEAHLALAIYYYNGFRDYGRARSELVIARRALPNSADVFRYTGMIDRREGH